MREKIQTMACIGTAHDYLMDAYHQVREAYEFFPDPEVNKMASRILSDVIDLIEIERKVNDSNEI